MSWLTSAPAAEMSVAVKRHAYKTAPTPGRFCRFDPPRFVSARQAMRLGEDNHGSFAPAERHKIVSLGVPAPKRRSDDAGVTLSNGRRLEFRSSEMRRVVDAINMRIILGGDILFRGETGTGKELMARLAHDLSGRSGRLVKIDCPAMTESLVESELFGYEKGAYTGAGGRHLGLIEDAQGGTVFFDEFGELPQRVQVKLLCMLQDRCIRRVGSTTPIQVDVLVVAATNRDLHAMVASDQFRDDLIYRFDEQIVIPPLRLRRDDIPLLADRFLQQECEKLTRRIEQMTERAKPLVPTPTHTTSDPKRSSLQFSFSEAARNRLARYDYPGNVRELQKIVSKAVGESLSPFVAGMEFRIAFERLTIDEKAVEDAIEATTPRQVADGRADSAGKCVVEETWDQRELRHEEETRLQLLKALRLCDWNHAAAAKRLGMSKQAFWQQVKRNLPLRLIPAEVTKEQPLSF
jgi:transcriptional regulator with GAF, ATPase, and Fis domain